MRTTQTYAVTAIETDEPLPSSGPLRRIDLASPGHDETGEAHRSGATKATRPEGSHATRPEGSQMHLEQFRVRVGELEFDAWAAGPDAGDLVILLHGFPQTGYSYRHQLEALAAHGYRAIAPDQRGYSPGARPTGVEPYAIGHLVEDVVGIVRALGRSRFHLVGHDWGGAVAWVTATRHPDMVETLTVLSTPHFAAFQKFLADPESEQARRSSYFQDFAAPGAEDRFLANDKAFFRSLFRGLDVPESDLQVYLDRLGTPAAMRAALNWYSAALRPLPGPAAAGAPESPTDVEREAGAGAKADREGGAAAPGARSGPTSIQVPTLYVWGTEDIAFSREAAELTREYVAAPYRFVALDGQGHWLAESAAEAVTSLLLEHLGGP